LPSNIQTIFSYIQQKFIYIRKIGWYEVKN
jgi:hypothetical protein